MKPEEAIRISKERILQIDALMGTVDVAYENMLREEKESAQTLISIAEKSIQKGDKNVDKQSSV